jgi:hypothetical protein
MTYMEKLLSEKERSDLESFYKYIDEVIYPFFKKHGYKKYVRRGHFSVIFQRRTDNGVLAIQYISLIGYRIMAFQVNISGSGILLFFNKNNENDRWNYSSNDELPLLLKTTIEMIEKDNLLKKWEDINL